MKKNNASALLLPKSHTGQRFIARFGNHLRFIEADNPYVSQDTGKQKKGFGKKPETNWRTEKKYRLRPRTLWRRFNDPKEVIGVNFGQYTSYVALDIDSGLNPNHPDQDEGAFKNLLGALESIGLCRPIILRSSWSNGLHVYYFFPKKVKSFEIACAMNKILQKSDIKIKSGQVELFPNAKSYNSFYNPLRLPLQPLTGATILDEDYQPFTDDVDKFLNMADSTAEFQDMELVEAACEEYSKVIRFERCVRGKESLQKFKHDLLDEFSEGFTAAGQTNNLLLTIACYGVVFMGLDEDYEVEALADYVEETITGLDGYEEYCNHQHEIRKRCLEVAKSSQAFYWAAGKPRKRQKNFVDNFGKFLTGVENGNEATASNTKQRLTLVLADIEQSGDLVPTTQKDFLALLINKSKAMFNQGFSPNTLRKLHYKTLWLPVFQILLTTQLAASQPAEGVTPAPEAIAIEVDTQIENVSQSTEVQHKPLHGNLSFEAVGVVLGILQAGVEDALNKDPKNAETPAKQQGDTPCKVFIKSETLKPASNIEGTHPALYGGFGERAAQPSEKLKKSSLQPGASQLEPTSILSQPASSPQPVPKPKRSPSQHSTPRPVTKSQAKEKLALEHQQREQAYLEHMQQLHTAQNALEAELKTPEYKTTFAEGMAAIRGILSNARGMLKRGKPPTSPPP